MPPENDSLKALKAAVGGMAVSHRQGPPLAVSHPPSPPPYDVYAAAKKAETIGAPEIGTRYVRTEAPWTLRDMVQTIVGPERPATVARQDPYGILAWERGAGDPPAVFGTTEPAVTADSLKALKAATGIRAYHGSPHDFDAFDLSKIGTGEGNQTFGHGLYFAEDEGVARHYRDSLSSPTVEIRGQAQDVPTRRATLDPQPQVIRRLADERLRNPSATEAEITAGVRRDVEAKLAYARQPHSPYGPADVYHLERQLTILDDAARRGVKTSAGGRMYEVNLGVKPERLLDWDQRLADQPRALQTRLRDVVKIDPTMTGADIYERAVGNYRNAATASDALRVSGVPGLKYLDAQSRPTIDPVVARERLAQLEQLIPGYEGATNRLSRQTLREWQQEATRLQQSLEAAKTAPPPTRNVVLWDPKVSLDILRKYAFLPPLAAGAAAGLGRGADDTHP